MVTKLAYCSFCRGAAGEGDKGAMLGCHAVSVGRHFTSEYYASPSDSSPRLRHNRGCEVQYTALARAAKGGPPNTLLRRGHYRNLQ